MAVDLATLALKVEALEVDAASKKLDNLTAAGGRTEKAAGGMSTAFRALGAALATVQLANMVKESALMAARYETMGAAMITVGNNAGYTGSQMAEYEKRLRSTGIAMIESRETLTKMAASHIDLAKATDLARIAQDAAVVGNINSSEAFDRMINGIRSAEVEVLRGIGLNVNFEQSYAKLADQLGKNAKDLTETEKGQARVNSVLAAGTGIAGTYEAAMGTAGKMLNSMQRYADDLKVSLGAAFGPAVTLLVDQMTWALKDANAEVRDGQSTIDAWGVKFRSAIISIEAELIRLSMLIDKVGGTMTAVLTGAGELIDVAMNIKGAVSDMYTGVDTGWVESELTKLGRTWNKVYEDRHKAGDKALQDLANLELKLTNEVKGGTSAQEQARIAAGKNGRTLVQNEEARSAALKKAEEGAKKARSAAEAAAKASAQEYQSILDSLEPARVAQEEYNKALAVLNKMDPTHETERYKAALEELNSTTAEAIKLEQYRNNIIGQRSDYEKQASQASMTDAEIRINNINREVLAFKEYGQRLVGLGEAEQSVVDANNEAFGERARKQIEAITDDAGEMGKMFDDVAKSIQGAFSDMFLDMMNDTDNAMDSIGDMFKKLLAEMATMAILNPIIVPIVSAIGSGMGISDSGIAKALGMDTSQLSSGGGFGNMMQSSIIGEGYDYVSGLFSGSAAGSSAAYSSAAYGSSAWDLGSVYGEGAYGSAASELGSSASPSGWGGLSTEAQTGWSSGALAFVASLLSGEDVDVAAVKGVGSGGGAYLGAQAGTMIYPGMGTAIGGVIGGILGALGAGSLLDNGPDTFQAGYMSDAVGVNYDAVKGMVPTTAQFTGGDTDSQIAAIYAQAMRAIQQAFDANVTALAETLPEEMSASMIESLAGMDLLAVLDKVSAGEIEVGNVDTWLAKVAEDYAEGLSLKLGEAYGSALSSFISTNGAEGLVGDSAAWAVLSDAVKENITASFQEAATQIAGGDIDAGLASIQSVTNAIAAIESAMAPITEVIATGGLTEYEKSIRSINIQFDNYAAALKAAGVDLEKYTDLEKARGIALTEAISGIMTPVNEILATSGMSDYEKKIRSINQQFDDYAQTVKESGGGVYQLNKIEKARAIQLAEVVNPAIQEAIDKENELAAARKSILDEQIAAYGSLTESVSAAAQRNYAGMSAAEANQFGGFLDFIGGANEALEELRDTGAETSAEFAKINEMIQQANTDMYDGLAQSRLMLGDATGALEAAMRNSTLTFEQFNNEAGQFVAGAFNSAYLQEQARAAAGLYSQASASFLSIPNAGSVMGALGDVILTAARDELGVVARGTASDIAQNNTYIYDVVSKALMDKAGREAQMALPSGPGVASVMQAQAAASASLATKYVPGFGNITGSESIAWAESMSALNNGLNAGKISTNEFKDAVEKLNEALPNGVNAVELTTEQMADAVEGAARVVSAAGVESINYYFGQLSFMADDLAVASDSASQAIASVTNQIGLMNSAAVAFGISANAAGELGGGVTEKGQIVADAARIISDAMTTQQADAEAERLSQESAFAGMADSKIRDLSLMLEGVTAYDTEGLRNAFVRLSAALGEGVLTQQQYAVMVNDSLDLYEDVAAKEAELASNLKTVMDEFRSIADSARSLADDLLVSKSSTLDNTLKMEEAQRQYRVALAGAMDGDQDAMGDLSSITSTMLSLGENTLSDRIDYQRMFATSIADIRGVETINDKRADEAAAQLAATNALKDEIAALREEIKAGDSTIASNTDKTRKRLDEIATVGIKVIA